MRKSEVQFHSDRREMHAAVNVKLRHWREPAPETVAADFGASPETAQEFAAWWAKLSDEQRQGWADIATGDGWEQLAEEARSIWPGQGAKVYSEGRSAGWAVVSLNGRVTFTREDVAAWDAIALGRWARFVRACAEVCTDLPYQTLWQAYANGFEPKQEARETVRQFSFYYETEGRFQNFAPPEVLPAHCPQCGTERGVAIPAACPHS